jgi:hypothetical protein
MDGRSRQIVDGFHRWTVSADPMLAAMTDGLVPVVTIDVDQTHRMMSTIRHNRARGVHGVVPMGRIVQSMIDDGVSTEEIEQRLMMEDEEVQRLANRLGLPKMMIAHDYGYAWKPSWDVGADEGEALDAGEIGDAIGDAGDADELEEGEDHESGGKA